MPNERRIDFNYGYRLRCEHCDQSNWLSADAYYACRHSGVSMCLKCGEDFSVGRWAIELRDFKDPSRCRHKLRRLAWYHTTTDPEWPSPFWRLPQKEVEHYRAHLSDKEFEQRREHYEDQALHLGTYEAAIESMLRRMKERDDGDAQFYLHRVELNRKQRFQARWRDENHENAAIIRQKDLSRDGLDGIRYLNAHESMGSISLAVVRGAIKSSQRVSLPVEGLYEGPSIAEIDMVRKVRELQAELGSKHRQPSSGSIGLGLTEMVHYLADNFLEGVSPVLRDSFFEAISMPGSVEGEKADVFWFSKVAGIAGLLTRHDEVLKALDKQVSTRVQPILSAPDIDSL